MISMKGNTVMPILVICDDRWHPAQTVRSGLEPLAAAGLQFDFFTDAAQGLPVPLSGYPAILFAKSNNVSAADETPWMLPPVEMALRAYVQEGGRLAAVHSGSAGYQQTPILRALLGGVFVHHPEQCPVTVEPLPGHALSAGLTPFTAADEHYHMVVDDPAVDVFLRSVSAHGAQPAGWTRRQGAGTVCMLTPGHNLPVWLEPTFQALIQRALTADLG